MSLGADQSPRLAPGRPSKGAALKETANSNSGQKQWECLRILEHLRIL